MSVEIICPQCGYSREIPGERLPPGVRWANCPRCGNRFELSPGQTAPGEPQGGGEASGKVRPSPPEWERRSEIGIWKGLYRTTKSVLFSPGRFFQTMAVGGGLAEPLAYGILAGVIGTMGGLFWQFLIMAGSVQSLLDLDAPGMALVFAAILLLSIPYVFLVLLLVSLVLHGCLIVLRGGPSGFEATFRVVAYSQATQVLSLVPIIGGAAAFLWLFVVQVIGLREIHGTSYGKIIVAYLIPFIVLLGVVVFVVVFLSFVFLR